MIWNDSIFSAGRGLEILTKHIAAEIQSVESDSPAGAIMPDGDELARSVAEFVSQHSPGFADSPSQSAMAEHGASNGVLIPSDYLLIMTCRALWAVGHEQAARTLLRIKGPDLNITESYAGAVFAEDLFPCLGMHSALVRALRPSSSAWSLNGPYWILNLGTVFSFLDAGLELTIWRILHALLKQLVVLWDVSDGRGTLGLKNLNYVSGNLLGFPRRSRQSRQFTLELIRYCEQDFRITANERKWQVSPAVVDLDQ